MEFEELGQETVAQPETIDAPVKSNKKTARIILIILFAFVALGLAGWGYYTYLRSSPHLAQVGKEALMVARIDIPMLFKKAGMTNRKEIDEDLLDALKKMNMEELVENPRATGMITLKPAYYWIEWDKKDEAATQYLVMPLSNGEKLAKFLEKIDISDSDPLEVEKKGQKFHLDLEGVGCVWNQKTLVMAFSADYWDDPGAMEKRAVKVLDQPKSASILKNKQFKQRDLSGHDLAVWVNTDQIATIAQEGFKQAKSRVEEIARKREEYDREWEEYNRAREEYEALRWANDPYYYGYGYEGYSDYPAFDMEEPQMDEDIWDTNYFEGLLMGIEGSDVISTDEIIAMVGEFRQSSLVYYLDFNKGEVVSGMDTNFSKAQLDKYGKIFSAKNGVGQLAKYLPQENLVGAVALNSNWNEFWKVFGKLITKAIESQRHEPEEEYPVFGESTEMDTFYEDDIYGEAPDFYSEEYDDLDEYDEDESDASEDIDKMIGYLKTVADGQLVVTMNLDSDNEEPYFTVAALTRTNKGMEKIVKEFDDNGDYVKRGNAYASDWGEDAFLIEDNAVIYTSNYTEYKRSELGLKSKQTSKIKATPLGGFLDIAFFNEEADLPRDIRDYVEMFKAVELVSKLKKGLPSSMEFKVLMADKSQNSLKTIWDMLAEEFDMFEMLNDSI